MKLRFNSRFGNCSVDVSFVTDWLHQEQIKASVSNLGDLFDIQRELASMNRENAFRQEKYAARQAAEQQLMEVLSIEQQERSAEQSRIADWIEAEAIKGLVGKVSLSSLLVISTCFDVQLFRRMLFLSSASPTWLHLPRQLNFSCFKPAYPCSLHKKPSIQSTSIHSTL